MSTPSCSVLVVDDEPYILQAVVALLSTEFVVFTANNADAAERILSTQPIDILLTDQRMPHRTGVELLECASRNHPETIRLLMTGYSELDETIDAINRGQLYYYLVKPWRTQDLLMILRNASEKVGLERKRRQLLQQLQQLNHDLELRVADRTRQLEQANVLLQQRARELERLALTDSLTGLFNRRAMDELALFEFKRHHRYASSVAVGFIDVDHFKRINTEHFLTGGDHALRVLAGVLSSSVREVDSVGRMGGEEFLILARETDLEGATVLAERIRQTVETSPIGYNGRTISLTVSLGFAVAEAGVIAEYQAMCDAAASALAEAKRTGRNRCVVISLCQDASVPTSGS